GTFRGKPRRNGRACGRQYLCSAICATQSKGPRGPTVGYLAHRTIYLAGQGREGFRPQPIQGADRLVSGQCWPRIPTTSIDTREEKRDSYSGHGPEEKPLKNRWWRASCQTS